MSSICFVVATPFTVNGFLLDHLRELSKEHEVTLCMNLSLYDCSPALATYKIRIIDVPLERKISLFADIKAFWILYWVFIKNRFDAIHSITPKAGLLAMIAALASGTPNRFHTFTGQVWANYEGLRRAFFKKIDRLIVLASSQTFADSPSQISYLVEQSVDKQNGISILGSGSISGVNLARFKSDSQVRHQLRSEYGTNEDTCVYLFVGRLCKDKGILDLLQAFKKIDQESGKVALWIVGPDEEGIEAQVSQNTDLGSPNIVWMGPTFSPERYMTAADVLVLPSYREGFGSVIIEAAACRVPAIAYRIPGVIDAVNNQQTGLLCSVGSVEELYKAMLFMLTDKSARIRLGVQAQIHAQEKFSSILVTQAWLDFYRKVKTRKQLHRQLLKRVVDLVLTVFAIVVFALPILLVGLCVLITSGRPVLYWSNRIGKNNETFQMPKFRSMRANTPALATHLLHDPSSHLTVLGGFLRKTSLDELPQLWCILVGTMSFVGPRPALFNQTDLIEMRSALGIDLLKPGLTGWAQVNGRDELGLSEKVGYDQEYLNRQSTPFDIYIMWLTFLKVIRWDGVSH
ncbi:sugar transferase [Polynucleobacter alcilacus]|uniref:sugar transferase n=1 Tax=Polynucleobacter alcilacus TaxID=1819739 RepID=UPI001C0C34FD